MKQLLANYFIKVGFYKEFLNVFVISGCLYLVKAASTTKNKIAYEEELSSRVDVFSNADAN